MIALGQQARLYQVKQTAPTAATKSRTWALRDLVAVDGGGDDSIEFALTFDKQQFDWKAPSAAEKAFFLAKLLQVRHSSLFYYSSFAPFFPAKAQNGSPCSLLRFVPCFVFLLFLSSLQKFR